MGMASSQARLLSIIARQHDVEFEAQQIQSAKVRLATESDAAYEKYNEALDATSLTINALNPDATTTRHLATFNAMTAQNGLVGPTGQRYIIHDEDNNLLLSEDNYDLYMDFKNECPNGGAAEFGLYAIGYDPNSDAYKLQNQEKLMFNAAQNDKLELMQKNIKEFLKSCTGNNVNDIYYNANSLNEEQRKEYNALMDEYKQLLYKYFTDESFKAITGEEKFDKESYEYYMDLYRQIQETEKQGGGVDFVENDWANSNDVITNKVKAAQWIISEWDGDKADPIDATSASTDTGIDETKDSEINKAKIKKAEAEYEHTLRQIDAKDKKYDMRLAKLDTERKALEKQYESNKKVIGDNIERSFGIFS